MWPKSSIFLSWRVSLLELQYGGGDFDESADALEFGPTCCFAVFHGCCCPHSSAQSNGRCSKSVARRTCFVHESQRDCVETFVGAGVYRVRRNASQRDR